MKLDYRRNESGRYFENPFLEACSRVHPATPFVFYIPIVVGVLVYALYAGVTTWGRAALSFALGWIVWDLLEYVIHRFLFHWEGIGPRTRRFHEIIHGYHHKYPDDEDRLVMPLGASIPLALAVSGLLYLVGRPAVTVPLFCGIVSGYLFYDFTHWSTHFRKPLTSWGRKIRAHHMAHHFAVPDKHFGLSHRWVDYLAGTLRKREEEDASSAPGRPGLG